MKYNYISFAAMILSLLGFSTSCDKIGEVIGGGLCMYGCPNADYEVSGAVSDEEGNPVEGIRVAIEWDRGDSYQQRDTLFTDEKGEYLMKMHQDAFFQKVTAEFEDVDGEANGSFESASGEVEKPDFGYSDKGKDEWYIGTYSARIDKTLKKKKE